MKNSKNLRIYLRNKLLSNFNLYNNNFIKFNNNNTIKSVKDKIRRFIKKKVDVLENFISMLQQRRLFLKELSNIRENRIFVNDTSLIGNNIDDIPDIYFYSIKEKNKNFAFDIRDLYQINCNPYTKTPFQNWIKIHVFQEIEKRDIYSECYWYPTFGDLNTPLNELFNIYCNYREKNDEFVYYSGEYHNNLVLAFYAGKEKDFKCTLATLCNFLPENLKNSFVNYLISSSH